MAPELEPEDSYSAYSSAAKGQRKFEPGVAGKSSNLVGRTEVQAEAASSIEALGSPVTALLLDNRSLWSALKERWLFGIEVDPHKCWMGKTAPEGALV